MSGIQKQEQAVLTGLGDVGPEPFGKSPDADEVEKAVLENTSYRRVLYTSRSGGHQQVAMHIDAFIPAEIHADNDQYFLVKKGKGYCIVDGKRTKLRELSAFWVERGSKHEIHAKKRHPLKLFVAYTPAHHPRGRVDENNVDLPVSSISCRLFG